LHSVQRKLDPLGTLDPVCMYPTPMIDPEGLSPLMMCLPLDLQFGHLQLNSVKNHRFLRAPKL